MRLTKQAIEHAQKRLNDIANKKAEKEISKLPKPSEKPHLSYEQKHKLIASGKAKLKPFSSGNSDYTKLYSSYEYPDYDKSIKAYESELSKLNDAEEKIRQKHNDAKQKVLDRIMFSDSEAALEAIEKFSASV